MPTVDNIGMSEFGKEKYDIVQKNATCNTCPEGNPPTYRNDLNDPSFPCLMGLWNAFRKNFTYSESSKVSHFNVGYAIGYSLERSESIYTPAVFTTCIRIKIPVSVAPLKQKNRSST